MKTIEMIINEIKTNETMQLQLAEAAKTNTIADFLKAQGCEATEEEFMAAIKEQSEELDEDDLDAVAGGTNPNNIAMSCLTLGIGCLAHAIRSALGGGRGKDELLCVD